MKLLIGSILASLVVIAIAAAAPVQAQFPAVQHYPGGQYSAPGYSLQRVQNVAPPAFGRIPTLPAPGQSLYQSADDYLHAVEHFAEEASLVRTVDRFTLRLIGRLVDQAASVRHLSRHSGDVQRLVYEFNEIESLQPRIESAVFGTGCPIIQAALGDCWNEVRVAFAGLSTSIQQVQVPVYSSAYGSRPGCGTGVSPYVDPRTSYRVPPTGFGQAGYVPRHGTSIDIRVPVQPVVPVVPQYQARRGSDLGSAILGGILSRATRGL
jgi:hypothetical protein